MALAEIMAGSLSAVPDPGTPEAIRDRLVKALETRAAKVALLEAYYDGDHPLPEVPQRMQAFGEARAAFENLSRMGVTNYMKPVADAPAQRLRPNGVTSSDGKPADDAQRIWHRNYLDADIPLAMHKAITVGSTPLLVWPRDGLAEITVEHPSQAIVAYEPGSRRLRAAGLKYWCEDDGSRRVVLYLPDKVYKWRSDGEHDQQLKAWRPKTDDSWPIQNPFRKVPLLELRANVDTRPATFGGGRGEFEGVLSTQARINKTNFDRLVTAEFQAFRQRWAIGWTPDTPGEAVQLSMSRLLTFADSPQDVSVGEFSQADFTGFLAAVRADVESIASITGTPLYALGQLANPPSGDALKALDSPLIANATAHRDRFRPTLNEAVDLALQIETGSAGAGTMVEFESVALVTLAEKADAAVKMRSIGVPDEALWLMFPDVTPRTVETWKIMRADQELFASAVPVAGQ